MTTIYEQAKNTIAERTGWSGGEIVYLLEGKAKVYVQAGPTNSGRLDLVYENGRVVKSEVGYLSLRKGWLLAMSQEQYQAWVERTGHQA